MCKKNTNETILIIGGGPASVACAETLRQEDFPGRIIIASKERFLPYDKPKLSKSLNSKADDIKLRSRDFFAQHDIELLTEKQAISVDTRSSTVTFQDGGSIKYDKLLLATGGTPRRLDYIGSHLTNVCYLRTPEDANYIGKEAKGKNVVVVGTSFIGMEVAAFLGSAMGKAGSVSVVGNSSVPFERTLGAQIGEMIMKICEEKNIKFYNGTSVERFEGSGKKLRSVILKDGTSLPADICVIGAGVLPTTDFLSDSGIKLNSRNQVIVNKSMRTSESSVYAAGDIVVFPLFIANNEEVNIQHWQMAHQHGRIAALNMMGKQTEIRSVPYFWTVIFGKSIRYTGYAAGYDDVIFHGDVENRKFVAYYTKGNNVLAAASLSFDPIVSQFAELLKSGRYLTKEEIQNDPKTWLDKLHI